MQPIDRTEFRYQPYYCEENAWWLPTHIVPRFRLIPVDDYLQDFASDRSHMRDNDGAWTQPPPPWSRIGSGMRLPDYRNVSTDGPPGRLLDLAGLLGR